MKYFHYFHLKKTKNRSGNVIPPSGESNEEEPTLSTSTKYPPNPVTIWRTYFVCNEWHELQNYRKTSPALQIFLMLLMLEGFGFKRWTIMEPGFSFGTLQQKNRLFLRRKNCTRKQRTRANFNRLTPQNTQKNNSSSSADHVLVNDNLKI